MVTPRSAARVAGSGAVNQRGIHSPGSTVPLGPNEFTTASQTRAEPALAAVYRRRRAPLQTATSSRRSSWGRLGLSSGPGQKIEYLERLGWEGKLSCHRC